MDIFAAAVAHDIADRQAETGVPPSNELIERNNLWLLERGLGLGAVDLLRSIRTLNRVSRQFARFFGDFDLWLTPTMAQLPPKLGHLYADVEDVERFFERLWRFQPLQLGLQRDRSAGDHAAVAPVRHRLADRLHARSQVR